MIFTTGQLELIATMSHARAPVARICEALDISEPEYSAWCQRLALGRAYVEPLTIPARPERKAPERARLRAERYFESVSEAPAPLDDAGIAAANDYYSM